MIPLVFAAGVSQLAIKIPSMVVVLFLLQENSNKELAIKITKFFIGSFLKEKTCLCLSLDKGR
jgi:hypothetical protein